MNVVQIPGLAPAVQQQVKARGVPCRKLSKAHRGLLVADIIEGNVILTDLSVRQLSAVVGVSTAYAHAALHMPPAERENVRRGLRPLVMPRPAATPLMPRERIGRIVAEIGFDATLTLLVANEPAVAAEAAA